MKQIRKGVYTKRLSRIELIKRSFRRRWNWFKGLSKPKKALLISSPFLAFLILTPLITYLYYAHDISDQERLMNRNNTGIVLMDRDGKVFYRLGRAEHRDMVPLDKIAPSLREALIASEDKDFYNHGGFSPISIMKAVYYNIVSRDATGYGGSTLTQQLAKNTLLSDKQTFLRKYQELAVSIAIEQQYSKDEILMMYLNSVFFGENAFGIEDAARTYFNTTPDKLTLAQSAMLVGVLPAPSAYSPISGSSEYAKQRQNTVLTRMVTNGYISEDEKEAALKQKLTYADQKTEQSTVAPHYTQMVLEQLYAKYGEERVMRSGYQVVTTLDRKMQTTLEQSVAANMTTIEYGGGSNAGAIAIEPGTGEVKALVGSADWDNKKWGKVNMATTPRQPGSSFKPIYVAEALAEGKVTPATILRDEPTDFNGWKPQNASRTFSGDISVRNALSRSLNIPAIKVMQQVGVEKTVEVGKRMGMTTLKEPSDYGLSLALGVAEVPLIEMTNAYAAFAHGGKQADTELIKSINNKFDKPIFTAKPELKQVQTAEGSFLISSILSDNTARAPIFGSSLTIPGRTAAVKTGTTDDNRDAWTIGYTPQLAIGVWVGNNDNSPMANGGSSMAGPIWRSAMEQALAGQPEESFAVPSGVVQRSVCTSNGGLSSGPGRGTYSEYLLASALPTNRCEAQKEPPKEETKQPEKEEQTPAECPAGQTGTPPNCQVVPQECPTGQTGTPPNCVEEESPEPIVCDDGTTVTDPSECETSTTPPVTPPGVTPRQ